MRVSVGAWIPIGGNRHSWATRHEVAPACAPRQEKGGARGSRTRGPIDGVRNFAATQAALANAASIMACVPRENSSGHGYGVPSRTARLNAAACSS